MEQENKFNRWTLVWIIVLVAILAGIAYYLFFAPTPAFEGLAPAPLQTARQISQVKVDPESIRNSQAFRNLRIHTPPPALGSLGRENPFLPF